MSDADGPVSDNHQSQNNVEAATSSAANDKIYERKSTRKVVRVLTVVAYVFFVSLAAIMLSLYYIFLWDPAVPGRGYLEARVDPRDDDTGAHNASSKC